MATQTPQIDIASSYDFVIVGGGTAGLVIAARLTEIAGIDVLVLEAGESHVNDPMVDIPAMAASLQGSHVDWQFQTVPQVYSHYETNRISVLTNVNRNISKEEFFVTRRVDCLAARVVSTTKPSYPLPWAVSMLGKS